MSRKSPLLSVCCFLSGVIAGWLLLALIRGQLIAFLASKPIEASRFAVLTGVFLVELAVLGLWVCIRFLPAILSSASVSSLKKSALSGLSQAAIVAGVSTVVMLAVYWFIAPSTNERYRSFTMTKVILPKATEQHFLPIRSTEVDRHIRSSDRARAAVDAALLAQILTGILIFGFYWARFAHRLLTKEQYSIPPDKEAFPTAKQNEFPQAPKKKKDEPMSVILERIERGE